MEYFDKNGVAILAGGYVYIPHPVPEDSVARNMTRVFRVVYKAEGLKILNQNDVEIPLKSMIFSTNKHLIEFFPKFSDYANWILKKAIPANNLYTWDKNKSVQVSSPC